METRFIVDLCDYGEMMIELRVAGLQVAPPLADRISNHLQISPYLHNKPHQHNFLIGSSTADVPILACGLVKREAEADILWTSRAQPLQLPEHSFLADPRQLISS